MCRWAHITKKDPCYRKDVDKCLSLFDIDDYPILVLSWMQRDRLLNLLPPSHLFLHVNSINQLSKEGFFACSLMISDDLDKLFVSLRYSDLLWFNIVDLYFKKLITFFIRVFPRQYWNFDLMNEVSGFKDQLAVDCLIINVWLGFFLTIILFL